MQVVVDNFTGEIKSGTSDFDMLVHPAVLAFAAPETEQTQDTDREDPSITDQLSLEGHAPTAVDSIDFPGEA